MIKIITIILFCISIQFFHASNTYALNRLYQNNTIINSLLVDYLISKIIYLNEFPEYKVISPKLWQYKRNQYEHMTVHIKNRIKCGYHYKLSIAPDTMIVHDCVMR